MDENVVKLCVVCNTEKNDVFFKIYIRKVNSVILKGFFTDIMMIKVEYYNEKNKHARFKDLDLRLKALEEKFTLND